MYSFESIWYYAHAVDILEDFVDQGLIDVVNKPKPYDKRSRISYCITRKGNEIIRCFNQAIKLINGNSLEFPSFTVD